MCLGSYGLSEGRKFELFTWDVRSDTEEEGTLRFGLIIYVCVIHTVRTPSLIGQSGSVQRILYVFAVSRSQACAMSDLMMDDSPIL